MLNLVSLLIAAALVSLQCSFQAIAANPKIVSNIESNDLPTPRRRVIANYVKVSKSPPTTVKHEIGKPLILTCKAHGKPAPTISWLKNGIPLADFEEQSNEIFSVHPLSIGNYVSSLVVPTPADGDVISCVATAGVNEQIASTTIYSENSGPDVLDFLSLPSRPLITGYFSDILQPMGTSVTLPCRTYTTTESQLFWMDNNGRPVYDNHRYKVLPSGDLHIANLIFEEDMGGFSCTVKNMYGEDTMMTFIYPFAS